VFAEASPNIISSENHASLGPKAGYDDDYAPDYRAAERQPEYFSPRPSLTQGSEAVEATVKWFNADKGFGFVVVTNGPDASCPHGR
jgi:hypothetical protein